MLGTLIGPELSDLIREKNFAALRDICEDLPSPDLAEIITEMDVAEAAVVFRVMPKDVAADVFEYLPYETQETLLGAFGQQEVAAVLNEMAPDDRTALLEELPEDVTLRLLRLLSPKERQIAQTLLNFPEGSVGRRMTSKYIAVRDRVSVGDVLQRIRQIGAEVEEFNVIYVVGDGGRLVDDIDLRELLLVPPETPLSELLDGHVVSLDAEMPQEDAVDAFKRYDVPALPVINPKGILVGVLTFDDVLDIAEEEETEDVQKMAAVEALEDRYLDVNLLTLVKKRGVWLLVLFVGQMLTISVMEGFDGALQTYVFLAAFIPLVISAGGNSGAQASSLIIRSIAVAEVALNDWKRVLGRELACGLILGGILGFVGFVRVVLWGWLGLSDYTSEADFLSMIVWLSLVGVVTFGSIVGSMLPFLLERFGFDPATGSTPLVATLSDVTGLLIYFGIALSVLSLVVPLGAG